MRFDKMPTWNVCLSSLCHFRHFIHFQKYFCSFASDETELPHITLLRWYFSSSIRRVNAVEARVDDRRAGDAHVHFARWCCGIGRQVSSLLQALSVNRVKLYDVDPAILAAFAGTNVEFIVGNEDLNNLTDTRKARSWVAQHVQSFLLATCITRCTPAKRRRRCRASSPLCSLYTRAAWPRLVGKVNVSTAYSVNVLDTSYLPSAGAFQEDHAQYIQPLLNLHAEVGLPFLVNAYLILLEVVPRTSESSMMP